MKTKKCKKCGEEKSIDDFHVHYTWCNTCAGLETHNSLINEYSDISSYTGKRSNIIAQWSNKVRLSNLYLARNRKRRDIDYEYVYVLYCNETKSYKIGYTADFRKRHQALCSATGCYLDLKYVIELDPEIDEPAIFIEKFLKDYFVGKKIRNEWFRLNKSDLMEIADLLWTIEGEYIYTETEPFFVEHWSQRFLIQVG